MEQTSQAGFRKQDYNSNAFKTYKIAKKILKYSFYFALFYFASAGFMAWD